MPTAGLTAVAYLLMFRLVREREIAPGSPEPIPWHTLSVEQVCARLKADARTGISQVEARDRIAQYGPNRLAETKPTPAWLMFLRQFNDFLIIILIIAALVSGIVLRELLDAAAIGVILLLNALLGFIQEYRAEHALAALKKLIAPQARVVRDSAELTVPTEELVPGDLLELSAGDRIPADVRFAEAHVLTVDESSLTGESMPVDKQIPVLAKSKAALGDRVNMGYAGTVITRGRARGIVVATGQQTEMGAVVELVSVDKEKTPLQTELRRLGARIAWLCLGVSAVVFISGGLQNHHWTLMFLTAISLAVAAIPEGLPAAVTVSLALGVQRMARKNALIRRLHAVETLGSTSFICSDKTGTMTVNRMRVEKLVWQQKVYTIGEAQQQGDNTHDLLRSFVLCNDAQKDPEGRMLGDALEIGLIVAAEELGMQPAQLQEQMPRVAEVPFDAERKAMSTVHRDGNGYLVLVKGAPEVIARLCVPAAASAWADINRELTGTGYRTLAFAQKRIAQLPAIVSVETLENGLEFLGLAALSDPPRAEVIDAIATCQRAGIKVAMVTGDHKLTAQNIAESVGLMQGGLREIITGPELEQMSDEVLAERVGRTAVYARVSPLQKVKIVRALKRNGHVVAMTGDGVNDAPALKLADIGVAMGINGTDVAKEAADMVLLDDNFATIVSAVREGRAIFANLRKFVYFLLSCNLKEVLSVFFASLVGYPIVLPIQLLWVNLITDGAPALALGVDPAEEGLMSRPPRDVSESVLSARNLLRLLFQGIILTLGSVVAYVVLENMMHRSEDEVRTAAFAILSLAQLFHAFNFRVGRRFYFSRSWLGNRYLVGAVVISVALQAVITYLPTLNRIFGTVPLPLPVLEIVLACSLIPVLIINIGNMLGLSAQRD